MMTAPRFVRIVVALALWACATPPVFAQGVPPVIELASLPERQPIKDTLLNQFGAQVVLRMPRLELTGDHVKLETECTCDASRMLLFGRIPQLWEGDVHDPDVPRHAPDPRQLLG